MLWTPPSDRPECGAGGPYGTARGGRECGRWATLNAAVRPAGLPVGRVAYSQHGWVFANAKQSMQSITSPQEHAFNYRFADDATRHHIARPAAARVARAVGLSRQYRAAFVTGGGMMLYDTLYRRADDGFEGLMSIADLAITLDVVDPPRRGDVPLAQSEHSVPHRSSSARALQLITAVGRARGCGWQVATPTA